MSNNTIIGKIKDFLGLHQQPTANDFRNPIWGSDDDDDGDELYSKNSITIHTDPLDLHRDFSKHMHEMFRSFGSMFGNMNFLDDDHVFDSYPAIMDSPDTTDADNFDSNNIRDYYLKPGYQNNRHEQPKEDINLDGKISSQEISGLLKGKDEGHHGAPMSPFHGNIVPGRSFCKTIITTSITKPDGSIETRRIIKNGNETVEETTTTTQPVQGPYDPALNPTATSNIIYNNILSELTSLFRNFN